jgi:hypothetical protein
MGSQSKGIGSADISASTYDKIRTIPARLHCASHRRDNGAVQPLAERQRSESAEPRVGQRAYLLHRLTSLPASAYS